MLTGCSVPPEIHDKPRYCDLAAVRDGVMSSDKDVHTGLPMFMRMNRIACCHPVSWLRSTVASPHTVIDVTQRNRESI